MSSVEFAAVSANIVQSRNNFWTTSRVKLVTSHKAVFEKPDSAREDAHSCFFAGTPRMYFGRFLRRTSIPSQSPRPPIPKSPAFEPPRVSSQPAAPTFKCSDRRSLCALSSFLPLYFVVLSALRIHQWMFQGTARAMAAMSGTVQKPPGLPRHMSWSAGKANKETILEKIGLMRGAKSPGAARRAANARNLSFLTQKLANGSSSIYQNVPIKKKPQNGHQHHHKKQLHPGPRQIGVPVRPAPAPPALRSPQDAKLPPLPPGTRPRSPGPLGRVNGMLLTHKPEPESVLSCASSSWSDDESTFSSTADSAIEPEEEVYVDCTSSTIYLGNYRGSCGSEIDAYSSYYSTGSYKGLQDCAKKHPSGFHAALRVKYFHEGWDREDQELTICFGEEKEVCDEGTARAMAAMSGTVQKPPGLPRHMSWSAGKANKETILEKIGLMRGAKSPGAARRAANARNLSFLTQKLANGSSSIYQNVPIKKKPQNGHQQHHHKKQLHPGPRQIGVPVRPAPAPPALRSPQDAKLPPLPPGTRPRSPGPLGRVNGMLLTHKPEPESVLSCASSSWSDDESTFSSTADSAIEPEEEVYVDCTSSTIYLGNYRGSCGSEIDAYSSYYSTGSYKGLQDCAKKHPSGFHAALRVKYFHEGWDREDQELTICFGEEKEGNESKRGIVLSREATVVASECVSGRRMPFMEYEGAHECRGFKAPIEKKYTALLSESVLVPPQGSSIPNDGAVQRTLTPWPGGRNELEARMRACVIGLHSNMIDAVVHRCSCECPQSGRNVDADKLVQVAAQSLRIIAWNS
ncbi:unnamed protein product [Notodromas monacha]|uniref:Uncharacterized protein n=1 Tax=Notodromas monacha TaxID=399045 RepID=A0A7R9BIW4_9CRUS|nr:unnamed protein product [Notodromas monacha]CAG0914930.1 unnamed protein product [Notodromas monacha]